MLCHTGPTGSKSTETSSFALPKFDGRPVRCFNRSQRFSIGLPLATSSPAILATPRCGLPKLSHSWRQGHARCLGAAAVTLQGQDSQEARRHTGCENVCRALTAKWTSCTRPATRMRNLSSHFGLSLRHQRQALTAGVSLQHRSTVLTRSGRFPVVAHSSGDAYVADGTLVYASLRPPMETTT